MLCRQSLPVLLSIALALACAAGTSNAQDIYKWTDAEGVVHFGERPPPNTNSEQVDIEPAPVASPPLPAATRASHSDIGVPHKTASAARQSLSIVMYARNDCGYCAQARRYFATRGIAYRELDIVRNAQATSEHKRLGGGGVPLFVINGQTYRGFSAVNMTRRLAKLGW